MEICGFIHSAGYDSAYRAYARPAANRKRTTYECGHHVGLEFSRENTPTSRSLPPVRSPLLDDQRAYSIRMRGDRTNGSGGRCELERALNSRGRAVSGWYGTPQLT